MKWKVENWQFYILVLVNARSIMIQYILIVANGVLVHICINDLLCMQYRKVENYTKNDMIELWGSPRIHRPALSYYNITIYICILYEWYIQKLNCSDNDRVWTKVFFLIFSFLKSCNKKWVFLPNVYHFSRTLYGNVIRYDSAKSHCYINNDVWRRCSSQAQ